MKAAGYLALWAVLGLMAPISVTAQDGPPAIGAPNDAATLVEALIVRPRYPGPAWWSVSDADTTVHVMVIPGQAPRDMTWDRSTLERRMVGANRLLVPGDINVANPLILGRAVLMAPRMRTGAELEPNLPEPVRAKFVALREEIGRPAEDYANWIPNVAASSIAGDYFEHVGLASGGILAAIEDSARRHGVRRQVGPALPAGPMMDAMRIRDLPGAPCVEATVDTVRRRAEAMESIALAWAEGNVRPLLSPPAAASSPRACAPTNIVERDARRIMEPYLNSYVAAFERLLRQDGHAVAIVDKNIAFTREGLLSRLEAKGYTIRTPVMLDD